MIKTGYTASVDGLGRIHSDTITCETVGRTSEGKAIWKDVEDSYACYLFRDGLFYSYEIQPSDKVSELYGTVSDEHGSRVEYQSSASNGYLSHCDRSI